MTAIVPSRYATLHARFLWGLTFLFCLMVVAQEFLCVNVTTSLPLGLYRRTALPTVIPREILVLASPPPTIHHLWYWWLPLLKPVAGIAGDVVCNEHQSLTVNGAAYGPIVTHINDWPLPSIPPGCQMVPGGMVFLASTAPRSLDGRYFGMTPFTHLMSQATPLLTWR